jgi:hypothetical protein
MSQFYSIVRLSRRPACPLLRRFRRVSGPDADITGFFGHGLSPLDCPTLTLNDFVDGAYYARIDPPVYGLAQVSPAVQKVPT